MRRAERDSRPDPFADLLASTRAGHEAHEARPIQAPRPIQAAHIPSAPVRESHREFLVRQHLGIVERLKTRRLTGKIAPLPTPFTREQAEYYASCRDATKNRIK